MTATTFCFNAKAKGKKHVRLKSFTLPELLMVLTIIGILVLLALPRLMPLIAKTKSVEAQLQLNYVHTLERSYYFLHSRYSADLEEIGFEQEKLVSEEGHANYLIEIISADQASFVARATAVDDFDGDGVLNVWEINQDKDLKEITRD